MTRRAAIPTGVVTAVTLGVLVSALEVREEGPAAPSVLPGPAAEVPDAATVEPSPPLAEAVAAREEPAVASRPGADPPGEPRAADLPGPAWRRAHFTPRPASLEPGPEQAEPDPTLVSNVEAHIAKRVGLRDKDLLRLRRQRMFRGRQAEARRHSTGTLFHGRVLSVAGETQTVDTTPTSNVQVGDIGRVFESFPGGG